MSRSVSSRLLRRALLSATTLGWAVALACVAPVQAIARDLRVLVSGIDSSKGEVSCTLYDSSKGFPQDADGAIASVRYPDRKSVV